MKELRQRVKNAKPTVNMKELRRRFARQDSGGGGDASKDKSSRNQRAASTAVQDKAGLNDKSADSSGDRKKSSQQTKKASGSTIDAIREAKRKHRLAVKASGRRKADTGKSGADVPVEVFVPPGYSFDLGTSNDTTIYTDGSITRNISVQNISSEKADGHANVSATNSLSMKAAGNSRLEKHFRSVATAIRRPFRGISNRCNAVDLRAKPPNSDAGRVCRECFWRSRQS